MRDIQPCYDRARCRASAATKSRRSAPNKPVRSIDLRHTAISNQITAAHTTQNSEKLGIPSPDFAQREKRTACPPLLRNITMHTHARRAGDHAADSIPAARAALRTIVGNRTQIARLRPEDRHFEVRQDNSRPAGSAISRRHRGAVFHHFISRLWRSSFRSDGSRRECRTTREQPIYPNFLPPLRPPPHASLCHWVSSVMLEVSSPPIADPPNTTQAKPEVVARPGSDADLNRAWKLPADHSRHGAHSEERIAVVEPASQGRGRRRRSIANRGPPQT